ncbi:amino acid permease [Hoyosella altamirensis]|uniref:Amino acid permease n=1 Tax=Hoyosella altamirensis TaxID=616997 RepID=A0A839RU55_9ACTN|nr:amino acid permease [Hoyosella altamirensis]
MNSGWSGSSGDGRGFLAAGSALVIGGALSLLTGWPIFGAILLIIGGLLMYVGDEKLAK